MYDPKLRQANQVLSNPATIVLNLKTATIPILAAVVVVCAMFLFPGAWWNGSDFHVVAQEPPTPTDEDAKGQSEHECKDDPSAVNCPPYGRLRASPTTIDIGDEIEVTAYDLFNVENRVVFGLIGPLSFSPGCPDAASSARASEGNNVAGGTAKVKVYGCKPGGTATIRLKTLSGAILHSITVTVRHTSKPYGRLRASPATIDIGGQSTVTAYDLFNVGTRVTFGLSGHLSFSPACADAVSSAQSSGGNNVAGSTATTVVYGCAPGGVSTVRLKAQDGTLLDSINITVNETSEPYGELSASATTIDIGEASKITAYDLRNFGTHAGFTLIGPLHSDPDCGKSDTATASARVPSEEPQIVYTAKLTVYGCFPGGIGVVQLTTPDKNVVDTISIKVNPGTAPYGELMATKTDIEIGQSTQVVAFNLFNVGDHVAFSLSGPISFNRICASTAQTEARASSSEIGGRAQRTIHGCVPGGTATLNLYNTEGDYELLASMTINVKPSPKYAPLIPAPGPAIACRFPEGLFRTLQHEVSDSILSPGGYAHTSTIQIWETLLPTENMDPKTRRELILVYDVRRCIEVRSISESTPGVKLNTWSIDMYVTRPNLIVPKINLQSLMQGDFDKVLKVFDDPKPKIDGLKVRSIDSKCTNCRGGTIQTVNYQVDGSILRHYAVHIFGQHNYERKDWDRDIELYAMYTISPRTDAPNIFFPSLAREFGIAVGEYTISVLKAFANWVFMHIMHLSARSP